MTSGTLTPKQSAFIAASISLFTGLFLFFAPVVPALLIQQHLVAQIEELEIKLVKYNKIPTDIKSIQQELELLKKEKVDKANFLPEKSISLAAADLQQQLKLIVEPTQAKLISSQPINNYEEELYPKVTIRVRMRGNINALQKVLYKIETGKPQFFIDKITIKKLSNNRSNTNDNLLDIRLDISAYVFKK